MNIYVDLTVRGNYVAEDYPIMLDNATVYNEEIVKALIKDGGCNVNIDGIGVVLFECRAGMVLVYCDDEETNRISYSYKGWDGDKVGCRIMTFNTYYADNRKLLNAVTDLATDIATYVYRINKRELVNLNDKDKTDIFITSIHKALGD